MLHLQALKTNFDMAEIAFLEMFFLISYPPDKYENRKHVHLYRVNKNKKAALIAKIWLEKNGKKDISIAYYDKNAAKNFNKKSEKKILAAIDKHWEKVMTKIENFFEGKKLVGVINLSK